MVSLDQQRISDQLVRLVQVFFALVLGQSLVVFHSVLLDPLGHCLAALAWISVFYTIVASWIDWHVVMARRPYDTRQIVDRFRIYSDVSIAILYAYLLFTIEPLIADPGATLRPHLLGYPLVFGLYLISGSLRRRVHGKKASRPIPMLCTGSLHVGVMLGYCMVRSRAYLNEETANVMAIAATFLLMLGYRWFRRHTIQLDQKRAARLVVGIDVDGVLADQITGVLPRITERHDVTLTYTDVSDWCLPIKDSDIKREILRAQEDRSYVIGMAPHEGARRLLKVIGNLHRVVVITARTGEAAIPWTTEWLKKNGLPYDEVIASNESKKSEHRTDVLIDDFIGNVEEFLRHTTGVGVLVDQPWNRDRSPLQDAFANQERLFIVRDLLELRMSWPDIEKAARAIKGTS